MAKSTAFELDYTYAVQDGLSWGGSGVTAEQLKSAAPEAEQALARILDRGQSDELGFVNLPDKGETAQTIETFVASLEGRFSQVLVLGIGGSSLGARALDHALVGPPELPRPKGTRRVYFPDNSDPWLFSRLLTSLSPADTLVLAISKSGGTVETASQFLAARAWLESGLGPAAAKDHLVFVTDPSSGIFRSIATKEGFRAFDIPPSVGGRFSVLTNVGLLPAELAGVSAKALLDGAREMKELCTQPRLQDNPAALFAVLHVLHHRLYDRNEHVLMPYADALRPLSLWFVQLWAESLGKRNDLEGRVVETGPTPIPAVGATDQHAQGQLFMEGPRNKLLSFLTVNEAAHDLEVPHAEAPLDYLAGKRFSEILAAQKRGTELALAQDGRPSLSLTLGELNASSLGGLFYFFEMATAIAGELYNVNTFDQPGVEAGKRISSALLGREGYEKLAQETRQALQDSPTNYRVRGQTGV